MGAATVGRDPLRKESDVVAYKMGIIKVYQGTLVSVRADGYLYPARSGTATDIFVGVAEETKDNTAGAVGDISCKVKKKGSFVFAKASAVIADMGDPMYASTDQDLTATSTNNQLVGTVCDLIDASTVRLFIDTAVK